MVEKGRYGKRTDRGIAKYNERGSKIIKLIPS